MQGWYTNSKLHSTLLLQVPQHYLQKFCRNASLPKLCDFCHNIAPSPPQKKSKFLNIVQIMSFKRTNGRYLVTFMGVRIPFQPVVYMVSLDTLFFFFVFFFSFFSCQSFLRLLLVSSSFFCTEFKQVS